MHLVGVGLDSAGRCALEDICEGSARATLHLAGDLNQFRKQVRLVRQALEIVLEVNDGGDEHGRRVVRVVADRHNFREVLAALSQESRLVQAHMGALMSSMGRLYLGFH